MATSPRTSTLPLPGAELDRLKGSLAREYGSQLWDGADERILVIRVPRPEPDLILDLETAIEHLAPTDTEQLSAALLVGDAKTIAVPIHPIQQLMVQRVAYDEQQCNQLRRKLAAGAHTLYRAPGDARKTLRLALRVAHPSVADVTDEDLHAWGATLGPDLASGRLQGVRAVYLVAEADHVRLDASLFFHDLRKQMQDAEDRHTMAQAIASKIETKSRNERVAYAPLRRVDSDDDAPVVDGAAKTTQVSPGAVPGAPAAPPVLRALAIRLESLGFDVMLHPAGHALDLAAERVAEESQRIVAWTPERVTPDVASHALATTRKLDVDLALMVCDDVEPEGRKRLIATKVRLLASKDVPNLDL